MAESLTVDQVVVGSTPIRHPKKDSRYGSLFIAVFSKREGGVLIVGALGSLLGIALEQGQILTITGLLQLLDRDKAQGG
jgi:hypothetical protein